MELSNENIVSKIIQEYEDVKLINKNDEITLINFPYENHDLDIKVNINKFISYLNTLYLKPKGTFTKEQIIEIIKEKLAKITHGTKNKKEKKAVTIDIFTFVYQFKDIMFDDNNKFKIKVFKKIKELFLDFNKEETDKIIYLYLGLFHVVSIKKNNPKIQRYMYKINDKNLNNIHEDSLDYYLDNI